MELIVEDIDKIIEVIKSGNENENVAAARLYNVDEIGVIIGSDSRKQQ